MPTKPRAHQAPTEPEHQKISDLSGWFGWIRMAKLDKVRFLMPVIFWQYSWFQFFSLLWSWKTTLIEIFSKINCIAKSSLAWKLWLYSVQPSTSPNPNHPNQTEPSSSFCSFSSFWPRQFFCLNRVRSSFGVKDQLELRTLENTNHSFSFRIFTSTEYQMRFRFKNFIQLSTTLLSLSKIVISRLCQQQCLMKSIRLYQLPHI